jgi:two-component system sensor histidine kinase/response regulator
VERCRVPKCQEQCAGKRTTIPLDFRERPDCISFFNIDGHAVFSNRAVHQMLGYTAEELSHIEKWDEIVHPDERAVGAKRYAELIEGTVDTYEREQRFIRRDGRCVVTDAKFQLLRDADGKPQYVVGLMEDITANKRAQEERNRIAKQMEMLLESIGQGLRYRSARKLHVHQPGYLRI